MMNAKFAGVCTLCHTRFEVGAPIDWDKNTRKASHIPGMCESAPTPIVVSTQPVQPTVAINNATSIVKFLTAAQDRGLKAPKVRFLTPDNKELKMSLAGGTTRYPGSVQVKVNDEWIGRVGPDGTVTAGIVARGLVATLTTIATDPATAAKAYGALMGRCTFCTLKLTDEGSVEMGYGARCADRYNLPHSHKGTPVLKLVPNSLDTFVTV